MLVRLLHLQIKTIVIALGLGLGAIAEAKVPRRSCPDPSTYERQWLVIAGSLTNEEQARAAALKDGHCLISKNLFDGIRADTFVVVADAKDNQRLARAALRRVRRKQKDAYIKFAGGLCGGSGPPVTADLRAAVAAMEERMRYRSFTPTEESHAQYWDFYAEVDRVPVEAHAVFHQGHDMRREFFFFEKGELVTATADEWLDNDDDSHSERHRPRSYYLIEGTCYLQLVLEDGDIGLMLHPTTGRTFVCPQACAPGVGAKIVARAKQVLAAAAARGAKLEGMVGSDTAMGTIESGWVESL